MSGGLVNFGDYIFPKTLGRFSSNFARQQAQTVRMPGMDGAWDNYGDGIAPAPVGKVTQVFRLIVNNRIDMGAQRDAVNLMQSYGTAKLYSQPTDPSDSIRWTWARLLTPQMPQDKSGNSDLWQTVTLNFECDEPVWWVNSFVSGWTFGDGSKYGDVGLIWGGGGNVIEAFGSETTKVMANAGNTRSIPTITVETQPGQSFEDIVIQRLEGPLAVEEISYIGLFVPGDVLFINGRSQQVTFNGSSDWDNFDYDEPAFINLLSGDNTIKVLLGDSGEAAPAIAYDAGAGAFNGTYNNVSVGGGIGLYNGSTSYLDTFSAGLATFFAGDGGTMISKFAADASILADGIRHDLIHFGVDANNYTLISKTSGDVFNAEYAAGGVVETQALPLVDALDHVAGQTWEYAVDEFKAYFDSVQVGVTGGTLGVWVGSIANSFIGAFSAASNFWKGGVGDVIVANQVLDATQMATISSKLADGSLTTPELNSLFVAGNWAWWQMNEGTQTAKVTFNYRDSYR